MAMLEDMNAGELAGFLEWTARTEPSHTGGLSALDKATMRWAHKYPALEGAQREFAAARHLQWPRTRTPATDRQLMERAADLARALRELGEDTRIALCREQSEFGDCCWPLDDAGHCPKASRHVSA